MASFKPSKILILGGTGTIGRHITAAVLRSAVAASAEVMLFTSSGGANARDPAKAALIVGWKGQGLARVIEGDLASEADVKAAFDGVDTVISCLGRGALQHQFALLRLAEASDSVQWFFPSEYGTDVEHNARSPHEKPHQLKLKLRAMVRDEIRRLCVTYVVTGPYFDLWVKPLAGIEVAGCFDVAGKHAYVIGDGNGRVGFCTMRDVGKFVAAALQRPDKCSGKALRVQSFVVTPNEVLAEYEKQTAAKWAVTQTLLDEIRKVETDTWETSDPKATFVTLRRIWAEGGTLYDKNDNDLVGLKAQDLDSLGVAVQEALAGGSAPGSS